MKTKAVAGRESAQELTARIWRLFWLVVLVAHIFLAVGWWWLEPGGFGLSHPRFWSNTIAPPLGLGVTIVALAAMHVGRVRVLRWLLPIWAAGWAAAAVAGRILFPITLCWLWLIPLGGAVAMAVAAVPPWRAAGGRGWIGAVGSALCAAVAGAALVVVQRPPPAHTHPRGAAIGVCEFPIESTASRFSGAIRLDPRATVYPADGTITVRLGSLSLTIQPLLTFEAGSKDGYWSILAPSGDRAGPEPRLRRSVRDDEQSCASRLRFLGARSGGAASSCRRGDRGDHDRRDDLFGETGLLPSEFILRH